MIAGIYASGYDPAATVPTFGDERPTRPRTMRRARVNRVTCARCLGAKVVLFQWFGEQECPECHGTGEGDDE